MVSLVNRWPESVTTWEAPRTLPCAFSAFTWKYGPWAFVVTAVSNPDRGACLTMTDMEWGSDPASTRHALVCVEPFQEA